MKKALIIDGNNLLYRVYYAILYQKNKFNSLKTNSVNATYIFIKMFIKYLKSNNNYNSIFVAFDSYSKLTFRHKILPTYKFNRNKIPNELIEQFNLLKKFLDLAKIKWKQIDNYEADDIIGSIVKNKIADQYKIDIISNDKDLWQLLDKNIQILFPIKGMSNLKIITKFEFIKKYGLLPYQIIDLKAIMGDYSDNLIGIKGIGPKNAIFLLKKYTTLENIIKNINYLKPNIQKLMKLNYNNGILCKKLIKLKLNISNIYNLNNCNYQMDNLKSKKLQNFYKIYNMKSLLISNINNNINNINNFNSFNIQIINKWDYKWNCNLNYLWLEINNKNYYYDNINGFNIQNQNGLFYINQFHAINCLKFKHFLKNNKFKIITWDLKKLIIVGLRLNFIINGIIFDNMLIALILFILINKYYFTILQIY